MSAFLHLQENISPFPISFFFFLIVNIVIVFPSLVPHNVLNFRKNKTSYYIFYKYNVLNFRKKKLLIIYFTSIISLFFIFCNILNLFNNV